MLLGSLSFLMRAWLLFALSVLVSLPLFSGKPEQDSEKRLETFVKEQGKKLSKNCPYRINLLTQGQTDKNSAGIRIAETAKQFADNKSGLLFFYQLYDHAMRVPHWHANAVEMGTVLSGKMRVVIWEGAGERKEFTVEKDGTWMIPQAALHVLENVGNEELTFLVAYNSPNAADRDFVTAWASLPDMILESAVGLSKDEIAVIKKTTSNRLSSYDPSAHIEKGDINNPLSVSFARGAIFDGSLGSIKRVSLDNDSKSMGMTLQQTILKPNTLRVPHWYTAGDTLLYVEKGEGFFSMMTGEGKVYNIMLKRGDLISLPVGTFHSFLNVGKNDLAIYEVFNTAKDIEEITLLEGAKQLSQGTLSGATGLSKESVQKIAHAKDRPYMVAF